MKKIINYEKDILFKTNIGEICSISLEHDFTIDDGVLKGDFIVSGEYKVNELSVNKEAFNYKLPMEYELDANVDLDTLSYDVENFEYNVHEDELSVYIDFGIRYEEKSVEPIIPFIDEDVLNGEVKEPIIEEDIRTTSEDKQAREEVRLQDEDKNVILDNTFDDDNYVTYHVHIVREGDTLESIALKYNVSTELIKEYNTLDSMELKSKLIIPDVSNE